jgi:hypothetical protein
MRRIISLALMSLKPSKEFMNMFKVVTAILAVVFTANMAHAVGSSVIVTMMVDGEVNKDYGTAGIEKIDLIDMSCNEYIAGMIDMPDVPTPGKLWSGKNNKQQPVSVVTHYVGTREVNFVIRCADKPAKLDGF